MVSTPSERAFREDSTIPRHSRGTGFTGLVDPVCVRPNRVRDGSRTPRPSSSTRLPMCSARSCRFRAEVFRQAFWPRPRGSSSFRECSRAASLSASVGPRRGRDPRRNRQVEAALIRTDYRRQLWLAGRDRRHRPGTGLSHQDQPSEPDAWQNHDRRQCVGRRRAGRTFRPGRHRHEPQGGDSLLFAEPWAVCRRGAGWRRAERRFGGNERLLLPVRKPTWPADRVAAFRRTTSGTARQVYDHRPTGPRRPHRCCRDARLHCRNARPRRYASPARPACRFVAATCRGLGRILADVPRCPPKSTAAIVRPPPRLFDFR